MPRLLLILDLDETLIYATESPLDRPADFLVGPYYGYRRPFLTDFLGEARTHFDLAVWTSSTPAYAECVVDELFPERSSLKFVWNRERCTQRFNGESWQQDWLKDLAKVKRLGYDLRHVLIIDDSPEKLQRHYGNHLWIRPFFGDLNDTELRDVLPYLKWISTAANVRTIEKRGWRMFARR